MTCITQNVLTKFLSANERENKYDIHEPCIYNFSRSNSSKRIAALEIQNLRENGGG